MSSRDYERGSAEQEKSPPEHAAPAPDPSNPLELASMVGNTAMQTLAQSEEMPPADRAAQAPPPAIVEPEETAEREGSTPGRQAERD